MISPITPLAGLCDDDPAPIVFETIELAVGYMEPWDVVDGLWRIWDSTGRRYEPSCPTPDRWPIELLASEEFDAPDLVREALGLPAA